MELEASGSKFKLIYLFNEYIDTLSIVFGVWQID